MEASLDSICGICWQSRPCLRITPSGWRSRRGWRHRRGRRPRYGLFPAKAIENFPWGFAVKTFVCDIDDDGDNDIIQSECDTPIEAGIVWLENTDGNGNFRRHWLLQRTASDYHSLRVFDYDLDGDLDVFSGVGPLADGVEHSAFVLENRLDAKDKTMRWRRHDVYRGLTIHEAIAGDVDNDGDVDVIIKPWNHKDEPKDFVFLENRIIATKD